MNRIYQGRVTAVDQVDLDGNSAPMDDWAQKLWEHHALFQDAVNYYVVCLLALASGESNETDDLVRLRERMTQELPSPTSEEARHYVWGAFRRRGIWRPGLRDSVAQYLTPGNDMPSFEECRAAVLAGNPHGDTEAGRTLLDRGLAQLLAKCTGEGGCQKSAKEFLPRYCDPETTQTFGEDSTRKERDREKEELRALVHRGDIACDSSELDRFRVYSIGLPDPKKPEVKGAAAIKFLKEAIDDWEKREPAYAADWQRLRTKSEELPESLTLPKYRGSAAKLDDRFWILGMYLFRYVEKSEFTLGLMRRSARPPRAAKKTTSSESNTGSEGSSTNIDPIRQARGDRGYVFRGFTSLPQWGGDSSGKLQWLNFDRAAFGEALKVIHQVEAKGDEREKERQKKEKRHAQQRSTKSGTSAGGESEESERLPTLVGDPRILRLEQLVDHDLRLEYEMSEGVEVKYGLHPRTIRGFRDISKVWNEIVEPTDEYNDALRKKLWNALTDYKKENAETIGSPVLFDELVKRENWIIWREPTAEQQRDWREAAALPKDAEFARDPLQALTDERELLLDIERLEVPVRLTPADAQHSRRQFYFSDVTDLSTKRRLRHDQQHLDCEIAASHDGKFAKTWVRIHFSAPRLLRDQLNSRDADAKFQQAMMNALGLSARLTTTKKGKVVDGFEYCAAVALMPELTPSTDEEVVLNRLAKENPRALAAARANANKRLLLNFPVTLEDDSISRALGKAERWHSLQFGGADGESYWLRWPSTWIDEKKERKKAPPAPWWKTRQPFACLSVDLGQRDAGAFALIEATPGSAPKPQSRRLGTAEGTEWWATVHTTGMLRLPGENGFVRRERTRFDGDDPPSAKGLEELSGARGRLSTKAEWEEACDICRKLGFAATKLLGDEAHAYSFPELNDQLLYSLRRAQGRLARLQSWSCIANVPDKEKKRVVFEKRRGRIRDQIGDAIEAFAAEEKKDEEDRGQELIERNVWLRELEPFLKKEAWDVIAERIKTEISSERNAIQRVLVQIADRIQPLRGRRWEWAPRDDGSNCHILRPTPHGSEDRKKLIAGQRGVSLARIEQLESLRDRCQSLNRALMQIPGAAANLGRSKRGLELPDPCPDLLDRLDALKEQRVNQTAHLVLAQALGVRLKAHTIDPSTRDVRDIHGEYERTPDREPVDFVVIENLKYYEITQRRSRSENARLMRWCRRHFRDKLIELCEPYGLRVVEEWPADTSKFCSLTGVAGFRAVEVTPQDREQFRWRKHLERLRDPIRAAKLSREERAESTRVRVLFDFLETLNRDLHLENALRPKWRTLLAPAFLGPIFVPGSETEWFESKDRKTGETKRVFGFKVMNNRRPTMIQADINAAINLGLRAIASPETEDIHVRIRAALAGEQFNVRAENSRERARWGAKPPRIAIFDKSDKPLPGANVNFYADVGHIAKYDRAQIDACDGYASSRGLWGTMKGNAAHMPLDWRRCEELNHARIEKWESKEDQIPM